MSLIIATHESPSRYSIVSDSLISGPGLSDVAPKILRLGPWLLGWAGMVPATTRLLRHLTTPDPTRESAEAALHAAFDAALPHLGPCGPNEYPKTGGYLLLVGPPGIVEMESFGTVTWAATRYRAIGVPDFVAGWFSSTLAGGGHTHVDESIACITAAMRHYPCVGGAIQRLDAEP